MSRPKTRGNGQGCAYPWHGAWMACVTLGYQSVQLPDGRFVKRARRIRRGGFRTKRDALEACGQLRQESGRPQRRILTFLQVYDAWEAAYRDRISHSTLNCYRAAKKYFVDLFFWPFEAIGVEDLQTCLDECSCGRRTQENMKACASLMYQWAVPRHHAAMNYAEYLIPGGAEGSPRPAFTVEQVKRIREGVGLIPHADIILSMIYTGFRPTELLSLSKDSLREDPDGAYLVGGIKTEAGRGRAVPVSPVILPIIRSRMASSSPWIFPKDDGSFCSEAYFRDTYFYAALEALGIQPAPKPGEKAVLTPYSCRHTFSNFLRDASGSNKDKAALIGHEKYETTERLYQSADLQNMRAIVSQF